MLSTMVINQGLFSFYSILLSLIPQAQADETFVVATAHNNFAQAFVYILYQGVYQISIIKFPDFSMTFP
jgi:hypothetical protein